MDVECYWKKLGVKIIQKRSNVTGICKTDDLFDLIVFDGDIIIIQIVKMVPIIR